jgi:GWxTD domain-containing protein
MRNPRWRLLPGALTLAVGLISAAQESAPGQAAQTAQFLSQARYLISNEERKDLLALPEAQQAEFIEQFWKRRDSDPGTPANEFKEEYFRRIRLADEMFTGESRPGWLTERGGIAIVYGEPARRERQPPPAGKAAPCLETWHYDDFPVVFTDKNCVGEFSRTTRDLSPLSRRNIATTSRSRSLREPRKLPFDFEVRILKRPVEASRLEAFVRLAMPYPEIWFDFREGRFETVFALEMELSDSRKVVRWKFKNRYPVSLAAAELEAMRAEKFEIAVPLTVEDHIDDLRAGKCQLSITMENETSKERVRKVAEFTF